MSDRTTLTRLLRRLARTLADWSRRLIRPRDASSRAPLAPGVPAEPNVLVAGALGRIRRLLGTRAGVLVRLSPEVTIVGADARDIERLLLRLVLIAHEAMEGSGVITIETELHQNPPAATAGTLPPGPCVRLSVSNSRPGAFGRSEAERRDAEPHDETGVEGRLASVARAAREIGGSLQIEQRDSATYVSLYLPVASGSIHDRLDPPT